MTLIDNERTKLLASALDRASTACFTVGIATPVAGYLYGLVNFEAGLFGRGLVFILLGWLFMAAGLHLLARRILNGLKS